MPAINEQFAVTIVGSGPTGLVLAIELGQWNIPCVVLEQNPTTSQFPKASANGARTLEHYRRLGIVADIRAIGFPHETAYFTRLADRELARLHLAGMHSRTSHDALISTWHTPEMPQRMQQMRVEKMLREKAEALPSVSVRYGWQASQIADHGNFVDTQVSEIATGDEHTFRSQYVIGCDGPKGLVRRSLGIRYSGEGGVEREFMGGQMVSTYFRAPELYAVAKGVPATMYWTFNKTCRAVLITANGKDEFFMFSQVAPGEALPDDTVRGFIRAAVGIDTPIEIIASKPWTAGYSLVAEQYSRGRALIAGDAAHLFTPTGGFGYNTAVDDVANLAWKLASRIQGWGGPKLIDSFQQERLPIAKRNTDFAAHLSDNIGLITVPENIEDATEAGTAAREELVRICIEHATLEFDSPGIQLGVFYEQSPIIPYAGSAPPDEPNHYLPNGTPGARMPHAWIKDGSSLLDKVGHGFLLLILGAKDVNAESFAKAAQTKKIPFDVFRCNDKKAHELYGANLVLVRPDQYIAWRGDTLPESPIDLLGKVCGW